MLNVVGEHCCTTSVVTTATSGSPVAAPALSTHASMSSTLFTKSADVPTTAKSSEHALMKALRESSADRCESMKSTTTLRLASPPCLLTYFAQPSTPSTEPWNRPGASGFSTSAMTAMWISSGVIPTSDAVGFSLLPCAPTIAAVTDMTRTTVATSATQRVPFTIPPLSSCSDTFRLAGRYAQAGGF